MATKQKTSHEIHQDFMDKLDNEGFKITLQWEQECKGFLLEAWNIAGQIFIFQIWDNGRGFTYYLPSQTIEMSKGIDEIKQIIL